MVYVLNQNGQPIMPTSNYAKVRILLKSGKAKVIKRCPFTIQLQYSSTNYTQKVSLGIDAGSKHIGVSATTESKVLYEADVELRFGRRSTGRMDLRLLDGTHINASVGHKNIRLIDSRKNYITERRTAVPPTGKPVGFPA